MNSVLKMQKKFIGIYITGLGIHDLHNNEETLNILCNKYIKKT